MTTSAFPLQWPPGWPRTSVGRRENTSRFKTTFDKARRELQAELSRLGAGSVVISSNVPLRMDGNPYSDGARRRIDDPGVAVYFVLRKRPMVMARDAFTSVHDNLRSIGLAVAHLRGLERHGGATMMERAFEGFAALSAPDSVKPWREVMGFAPGSMPDREGIELQFRILAKRRHPDAGGSDALMAELNSARDAALHEVGHG